MWNFILKGYMSFWSFHKLRHLKISMYTVWCITNDISLDNCCVIQSISAQCTLLTYLIMNLILLKLPSHFLLYYRLTVWQYNIIVSMTTAYASCSAISSSWLEFRSSNICCCMACWLSARHFCLISSRCLSSSARCSFTRSWSREQYDTRLGNNKY